MESVATSMVYGAGTDPVPFFLAAYGLGVVLIGSFTVWTIVTRRRLRQLLATVRAPRKSQRL